MKRLRARARMAPLDGSGEVARMAMRLPLPRSAPRPNATNVQPDGPLRLSIPSRPSAVDVEGMRISIAMIAGA